MVHASEKVTLSPLSRADGSASYTNHGFSVICAVNGPVEVQRRDELPEEAAIDVVVRPPRGVGGIRERHFESILENTLRSIILVSAHPRTLIQITLQIVADQVDETTYSALPQAASNISILPSLLQSAMLALLSTSIPLSMTMTSALIAVDGEDRIIPNPTVDEVKTSSSVHVFAFSSLGDLLVVESEGDFNIDIWQGAQAQARQICRGRGRDTDGGDSADVDMDSPEDASLEGALRSMMEEKMVRDQRWKQSLPTG